jgi:uncharacterized protein DUF4397
MGNRLGRTFLGILTAASTLMGALALSAAPASPAAAQQADTARVRVVHASPDAPAVDIYLNDGKAISSLAYKSASDFAAVPAGSYAVKVTAAGATDAVISATLPLEAGKSYTVVAVGQLADIAAQVFVDDTSDLAAGKTRLRVIHASPNTPGVDVAVTGGPVLINNLAFPNASDNLTVDAGTYNVEVRPAGTTTAALSAPGLALEAGKYYTVLAVGLLGGSPALELLPIVDTLASQPAATTAVPPMVEATATPVMAPGMPQTGAGENAFSLAVLALLFFAGLLSVGVGVYARSRR